MSEEINRPSQNGDENDFAELEQTLRAILGDQAATEIIDMMKSQGFNPKDIAKMGMHQFPIFPGMPGMPGMPNNADNDSESNSPQIFTGENFTVIANQIQNMFNSSGADPVDWKMAEKIARQNILQKTSDSLTSADADKARDILRTASLWLDAATNFGPTTGTNMAWKRLDWITHSLPTFKLLLNPVGENIRRAISDAFKEKFSEFGEMSEELASAIPLMNDPQKLFGPVIGSILGIQYGGALASLASNSFGTSDTGLPLMEASTAALVPANISEFAKDLDIEESEVLAYIAVREIAAARLFTHATWLRPRILDTVAEYARGIEIDTNTIEEKMRDISVGASDSITEIDLTDIFVLEISPAQKDALDRLEHLISLVEGWVSEISARAVAPHLPNAVRLREMFTRRYATNNPAKSVWETQLGMQLTPRLMRDAVSFWQMAEAKLGIAERDQLWAHPDLLPSAQILNENMEEFFSDGPSNEISAELDSFLAELFEEADAVIKPADADNEKPESEPESDEDETDTTSN